MHSVNGHNEPDYRDKYTKFSYSSHFPWCIMQDKSKCVWDGVLVFRDPATGEMAGRGRMITGRLLVDGVERVWTARLAGATIRVKSTIRGEGAFEYRRHEVEAPPGTLLIEGSYALAASGRGPSQSISDRGVYLSSEGSAVAMYAVSGYDRAFVERSAGTNIVHSEAMPSFFDWIVVNPMPCFTEYSCGSRQTGFHAADQNLPFEASRMYRNFPHSSLMRSCSHRVMRFNWAFSRQLYPPPFCDTMKPASPLLTTFVQGRGVRWLVMR